MEEKIKVLLKKLKLNSIRSKLIISLVSICIIPLIITGFFSYNQSKSILNNKLNVTSIQTITEINNGLMDYLNEFIDLVTITSNKYELADIDTGDNFNRVPDMLKCIQEGNKDILAVYYGTASGKFINYPVSKMPEGYDASARPWYKQAVEAKGKAVITSPYKDAATGDNVITIARAVEKNGKLVGVVGLDCTLNTLTERITAKKIGSTGVVFIADAAGTVLAHPDKKIINTDEASKLSFWDKAKTTDSGFVQYAYNGVQKFAVYQTNQLTGWKLVAALEESELSDDTKSILLTSSIIILIMFLIAVGISLVLSRGIAVNVKKLEGVFDEAAKGDLSTVVDVKSKDELGELGRHYNSMIKNIGQLIKCANETSYTVVSTVESLSSMAEETTASMTQVALAVSEISQGANNLAENSQETASGMSQLSDRLDNISEITNDINNVSQDTKNLSKQGIDVVSILIAKNNETMEASTKIADIISDMDNSVKEISTISDAINGITEQTNLLALNASIEAARAGEVGKGFAVVADEIRKLADESKRATEEIKSIIGTIQSKATTAVHAMDNTKSINSAQNQAVEKTEHIFTDILLSISTLAEKVGNVKESIENMQDQKEVFVSQVEHTSAISEETASATEEVTASTEEVTSTMEQFNSQTAELHDLAEQLKMQISKFKI